ncbi:Gfo/Idh/MocA family protein [Devosia ginsengisoli]|uniref:Gfo/Idh/MocA family oxidoreductase n=1 Tax=Devosia ginsengisoli TaxID=400770 RepID=A0A5B8LXY8_9HYPH|nr:Gfo/Idh/MocA family oxidoreductase [Devosia ginsengisoli]QDZ12671.1 Gfo/Idh/MocA family oxidoreductase [Devosia ginsengisoli]
MSETTTASADSYALTDAPKGVAVAPDLPYQPRDPQAYRPRIALIGAGGITFAHLGAYRQAGYDIVAICDQDIERARNRRDEFYPEAAITTDVDDILGRDDIAVVDIATHPAARVSLIERALDARKHVLSQKPFVLDLDVGEALVERADRNGVKLAVNQNGRWAPHFGYMREAVRAGVVGEVQSVHLGVHWDHTWTKGTPFEDIDDLVFYDFAIHWFDFLASLIGDRATNVFATRAHAAGQQMRPPMLAQALVEFEGGQCSLAFDAHARFGPLDTTYISGTEGSLVSQGPNLGSQAVTLYTAEGEAHPLLQGAWFNDGFHGAMGELLCAIEEDREPINGARGNLLSLQLCFAAIASSHSKAPVRPGTVRKLSVA